MFYNCFPKTFLILHLLFGSSKVQTLPKEFGNVPESHLKYYGLPSLDAENCKADGLECKVVMFSVLIYFCLLFDSLFQFFF